MEDEIVQLVYPNFLMGCKLMTLELVATVDKEENGLKNAV